ncbi:hypothetical protein DRE_00874 [Drechslerella stenobrocha 248]|uniref:Uncharacterized protein n=1 Tax=Drechslerella stenobrocha 248 TaxID=1043628 RepID=W7I8Z8_9PEZI|nr:hypothetical protein DRE_00874 [Drechslerella stenobrocha 248]
MATQSGKFTLSRFRQEQKAILPVPNQPLDGLTILITGANTGVGFEAARHAVRLNAAHVIIGVRTVSKGEAAKAEILKAYPDKPASISIYAIDYCSLASVKAFADKVNQDAPKIHIAILNAGINSLDWNMTGDGWESVLQVNVLSTTYLGLMLLPKLRESYNKSFSLMPALVVVSSDTQYTAKFPQKKAAADGGRTPILKAMNDQSKSAGMDKYFTSKLFEVWIVRQLAKWVDRNMQGEVIINCVNPGLCHSELNREKGFVGYTFELVKKVFARTAEVGSRNYWWAATAGRESHGQYVGSCEVQRPAILVTSEEGQKLEPKIYREVGEVLSEFDPTVQPYFS